MLNQKIRGTVSYSCRFDWLQGKFTFDSCIEVKQFLNRLCSFFSDLWGGTGRAFSCGERFHFGFKSVRGMQGGFNLLDSGVVGLIQLPGALLCQLEDHLSLVEFLSDRGLKFTRVDVALDDFERRVSFEQVRTIGNAGHYRLLDSFKYLESTVSKGFNPVPTCYFGKAHKVVRFYDAEYMHGIKADRWELQLRGQHAQAAIAVYLRDQDCLPSLVVGAIDFGMFGSDSWYSWSRFDWWQSLVDEVVDNPRKLELIVKKPDIVRSASWIDREAGVILAVLYDGLGEQFDVWLKDVCVSGRKRFRDYHSKQVEYLRSSHAGQDCCFGG